MLDRTSKAIQVLESRGYNIVSVRSAGTRGNKLIHTTTGDTTDYFFLKNDTRPWFKPNDVSFKGIGLAVNEDEFIPYIRPNLANFLYSWGEKESFYYVPGEQFIHSDKTIQPSDNRHVRVYPLSKSENWTNGHHKAQKTLF